jgi:mycothiol system anti-sigma-R factor
VDAPELISFFDTDCNRAVHELAGYLDGELDDARREVIRAHLERCKPCAAAAHFELELRQVISDRCRDRVPDALRERIAKALQDEAADAGG